MALKTLDEERAGAVETLCELIVPGSESVGPVVYVDAALTGMPPGMREFALAAQAQTPEFGFVRALAIEAYYSDFVAPGKDGPGAYEAIDFNSPLATRVAKDWSYMGIA